MSSETKALPDLAGVVATLAKYGPTALYLLQNLAALLEKKQVVQGSFRGADPSCCAEACACLCEQRKALCEALAHNLHLTCQCGG